MTINKLKKRYYILSLITSIIVAGTIIVIDKKFNTFIYIPFSYNTKLKNNLKDNLNEKNLFQQKILKLKKQNEIYLTFNIDKKKLKNNLDEFFNLFSKKIKIISISVDKIENNKLYFNKAKVTLIAKSTNQYITTKFAVDFTIELVKEAFGKNAENIKAVGYNKIKFDYINYLKKVE